MSSLPGLSSHHGVGAHSEALQSVLVQSRQAQFGSSDAGSRAAPGPPPRPGPSGLAAFCSRPSNLMLTLVMGMALVYLAVFTTDTFSLSHPHGLYRRFQDHYTALSSGPSVSLLDSSDPTWQALPASERLAILQSTIQALNIKVDAITQEMVHADHGHSHHVVEDLPPATSLSQQHPNTPQASPFPPVPPVTQPTQMQAAPSPPAPAPAPAPVPAPPPVPAPVPAPLSANRPVVSQRPFPVPPPSRTSSRVYTEAELDAMVSPTDRQVAIKNAMLHSWEGYEKFCWGKDEFRPISGTCMEWIGLGLTIIDSLDTLHLMGLTAQFQRAKQYVASMNIRPNQSPSMFETTIRILGGLAAAYDLTGERVFLDKEIEVAKVLSAGFNTPTGIPVGQVSLRDGTAVLPGNGQACLAELGSLQLEFFHAAHHGNNETFYKLAHNVYDKLDHAPKVYEGLYPSQIGINDVSFRNQFYTMGAMADSFYEYLIKLYLLTNRERPQYKRMWMESVRGMRKHLVAVSPSGYTYLARLQGTFKDNQMEHFACFVPGNLMLGAMHGGLTETEKLETTELAKALMDACIAMYTSTATGISFDVANFGGATITAAHPGWPQRPECVESLFYLWRFTKDQRYRDAGWQMFKAMELRTRVASAHVSLSDANSGSHADRMESFWLGETLKYFYLLFAEDNVLPLDQYVFNTEAHPIKIIRNFRFGDKRDWKAPN